MNGEFASIDPHDSPANVELTTHLRGIRIQPKATHARKDSARNGAIKREISQQNGNP
jgi:hypothetical protein